MSDDEELTPPTPKRVAHRALALACTSCRGFIEEESSNPEAEKFRGKVYDWTSTIGISSEFEKWEKGLLGTPLGQAPDQQITTNALWAGEGLVILAWALGRHDLPDYDDSPLPARVAQSVGFMQDKSETVLAEPKLIPYEEIENYGNFIFALHWRLTQYRLDHKPMNFEETARTVWFGPLQTEGLRFINGDIALKDTALSDCDPNLISACLSMTMERHRAANWLLGHAEIYFDTETNT